MQVVQGGGGYYHEGIYDRISATCKGRESFISRDSGPYTYYIQYYADSEIGAWVCAEIPCQDFGNFSFLIMTCKCNSCTSLRS